MTRKEIDIPTAFTNKLGQRNYGIINLVFSQYSEILTDNKLKFFPEYTDHGIEHVENLIFTSEKLICKESLEILDENDIVVLLFSILLHDLGMHLNEDGLQFIIQNKFNTKLIPEFEKLSWNKLWTEYNEEVRKFNDDQLESIFGTRNVKIELPNFDNMDDFTVKLCGEFIRRNHARLAHEIALYGFPSKKDVLPFAENSDNNLKDIAGLVARSHGMSIRNTFDYLKSNYTTSWSSPFNVKVIYLMTVLRIADYIQVQKNRAPEFLLNYKHFSTPYSFREWQKHNAIKFINTKTDDPELIYVHSEPQDSYTFVEIEKLLKDIQQELDLSWAVLGEVYGRHTEYKNLKLQFRRIRSNIENKDNIRDKLNFIPEKIKFDADPDLLKLLIGPLYGEDSQFGVRELLQNAYDAVIEREYINKNNFSNGKTIDKYIPEIKIQLTFTDKSKENKIKLEKDDFRDMQLVITDNGVGMTEHTIINYFLKAGASLRKSNIWRKNFFEEGSVQIPRTGRFGIGVLAAFLFGDKIEVLTKYIDIHNYGLYFTASLITKQIDIIKVSECDYGTKIIVHLNESTLLELSQHYFKNNYKYQSPLTWLLWYRNSYPTVNYLIPNSLKNIFAHSENSRTFPSPHEESYGWRSFHTKDFMKIFWTFNGSNTYNYYSSSLKGYLLNPILLCNGFIIPTDFKTDMSNYNWPNPRLSIYDSNSNLPLSLNRNYLYSDTLPFEEDLINNIAHAIITHLLKVKFTQSKNLFYLSEGMRMDFSEKQDFRNYIIVKGDHYTLNSEHIFKKLNINHLLQFYAHTDLTHTIELKRNAPYIFIMKKISSIKEFEGIAGIYPHQLWFSIGTNTYRHSIYKHIFIKTKKYSHYWNSKSLSNYTKSNYRLQNTLYSPNWSVIVNVPISQNALGDFYNFPGDNSTVDSNSIVKTMEDKIHKLEEELNRKIEVFPEFNSDDLDKNYNSIDIVIEQNSLTISADQLSRNTIFDKLLDKYIGPDYLIPIDIEARKRKFSEIFSELKISI